MDVLCYLQGTRMVGRGTRGTHGQSSAVQRLLPAAVLPSAPSPGRSLPPHLPWACTCHGIPKCLSAPPHPVLAVNRYFTDPERFLTWCKGQVWSAEPVSGNGWECDAGRLLWPFRLQARTTATPSFTSLLKFTPPNRLYSACLVLAGSARYLESAPSRRCAQARGRVPRRVRGDGPTCRRHRGPVRHHRQGLRGCVLQVPAPPYRASR